MSPRLRRYDALVLFKRRCVAFSTILAPVGEPSSSAASRHSHLKPSNSALAADRQFSGPVADVRFRGHPLRLWAVAGQELRH
jgi:hypothetical protein